MEGGGKGFIFFFWKCFFHYGEAREGKGVIFCTNSLWEGGRVHLDFFSSFFFTVEGEGGGG